MEKGKLLAYVYTSSSQIPVSGADVTVFKVNSDGNTDIIAARKTNENGRTSIIEIDAPDYSQSRAPENGENALPPFAVCDIKVDHIGYESVLIENTQIFAETTTVQNVALIPLEENAGVQDRGQIFNVTPQNL